MIHAAPERRWIMAERGATQASRGHRTICVPSPEPTYQRIIDDPRVFRRTIDDWLRRRPELFPRNFQGYQLMGHRVSAKRGVTIRRVRLKNGTADRIRPSFLMPDLTARTEEVQGPLFLRKFGVPFWALARVFGATHMAWYRRECALGRFSIVGTTVRQAELPAHLLADEHHQSRDGQKLYIATTVGRRMPTGSGARGGGGRRQLGGCIWSLQGRGRGRHCPVRSPSREPRPLEGHAS